VFYAIPGIAAAGFLSFINDLQPATGGRAVLPRRRVTSW
jgi:hypothetical protein